MLVDRVTQDDRESFHLAETELHATHISQYDHAVTKIVFKIKYLAATLEANATSLCSSMTEILRASPDDNLCEDSRMNIKMIDIKIDQGREIDANEIFNRIEKKCANLVKQKK